ncbi:auxin-repressed protein [Citrus sinensis]|uniref:dormancy-associated protein homolog 4 isoform X3 n=1 Tax=Citrus sinensis TaxID=2711 RepID=UPI002199B367|nr:dormancy-associated protein homolog 4 isoform X3 [Citrus sinensis]KAH9665392.1 auxin-repressed protein [Citrus sinensis]
MGFLHKLWDETLAGPTPDSGLGKLRKNLSGDPGSPSGSCSSPRTPLTPGTPPGDFKRFTRRKPLAQALEERAEPRSPTVYDWIVISALDR